MIDAPFGRVAVELRNGAVVEVNFLGAGAALRAPATVAGRRAVRQLVAYLRNSRARINLPLALPGTDFQQRVWRALRRIRAGAPLTYGELARRLRSSARAVGGACRANPAPIVVPCHRVVAATGDGGFMGRRGGRALALKRWLLEHERSN